MSIHRFDINNSNASTREKNSDRHSRYQIVAANDQVIITDTANSGSKSSHSTTTFPLTARSLFHRDCEGVPLARAGPAEPFPGDAEIYSSPTLPIILLAHERASHRILYTTLKCHPLIRNGIHAIISTVFSYCWEGKPFINYMQHTCANWLKHTI